MNNERKQVKTIEHDEKYLKQISKPIDFQITDYKKANEKLDYFCKNDNNILAIASIQLNIPLRLIYLKKKDKNKEFIN